MFTITVNILQNLQTFTSMYVQKDHRMWAITQSLCCFRKLSTYISSLFGLDEA